VAEVGAGHLGQHAEHDLFLEELEEIDAHADQGVAGVAGDGRGVGGFLVEGPGGKVLVNLHDAVGARGHAVHFDGADGHVRAGLLVVTAEETVVHLVDVIAGEDEHVAQDGVALDQVDVLAHRVGGALVPFVPSAHLGANDAQVVAQVEGENVPARL